MRHTGRCTAIVSTVFSLASLPALGQEANGAPPPDLDPSGTCMQHLDCDVSALLQVEQRGGRGSSGSTRSGSGAGIASWFTKADFAAFFPNIDNAACSGKNFFTHAALLQAASHFPSFANTGDLQRDKRELAAFLGQTSHETTGGWATAPGGPAAWGYCFKEEVGCAGGKCTQYCVGGNPCRQFGYDCTCVPGKTYNGRGPVQLSYNYNYGQASKSLFGDPAVLLQDPDQVANNATLAYLTGLWFWMTPQSPKPSCHEVMAGTWSPTAADTAAHRVAGYGLVTNIINGGLECGGATDHRVEDRVNFYKRFAELLNVPVDVATLYCNNMSPW